LDAFDADDLYLNLEWLYEHQTEIENRLFRRRHPDGKAPLFLYDVTSSYLEGTDNELAAFGYNRDGKQGKRQIVIGLLCDEAGWPLSVEVFDGNTADTTTFASQIRKVATRFGGGDVTLMGDRGIEERLAEVTDAEDGVRYVLRRNPLQAAELPAGRQEKLETIQQLLAEQNTYLTEHPRATVAAASGCVQRKITQLRLSGCLSVAHAERTLTLTRDETAWQELSKLDGCYCLKTDVPAAQAAKELVHERYKDLAEVEWAFRTSKSTLEVRPIFVRKESRTRGHVFVVMLAYYLLKELAHCWRELELTPREGVQELATLCMTEVTIKNQTTINQVPTPREMRVGRWAKSWPAAGGP